MTIPGAVLPVHVHRVVKDNGDCTIDRRRFWVQVTDDYVDIFATREMRPEQGFSVKLADLLGAIARASR